MTAIAAKTMSNTFHVALTADFMLPGGGPRYPSFDLDLLRSKAGMQLDFFHEHRPEIGHDQIAEAHGVIVLTPKVTAHSVANAKDLLAIGRFGVGYDAVDITACTEADVAVFITSGAVDRSVAEATLSWMLALTHQLVAKDRLVREGRWDERSAFMGRELRDRTLGIVGFGGIGRALAQLTKSFGMLPTLVFDPFLDASTAASLDVKSVSLDDLLAQSDFVSIHCPLNAQTRNLIGARELGRMKPQSYLFNTARGGIVDEDALYDALATRRIAGAALDCFADEPVTSPHRFGKLDNVLLAPHCISWTEELFRDIGRAASQGMIDLANGTRPRGVVNPEVFERDGFQKKWSRFQSH